MSNIKQYNKSAARASDFRTICEVLREIGDVHQEATPHDEKVRALLMEATNMGKRMDRALREEHGYALSENGYWTKNKDRAEDDKKRKARV